MTNTPKNRIKAQKALYNYSQTTNGVNEITRYFLASSNWAVMIRAYEDLNLK